jgi:hypothetical protein
MDLEAVESALRTALHQAGASGLSELLQYAAPAPRQRQLPCPCGHQAQYQALRSKPLLTVLGPARVSRPYYLCSQCHHGQFPADVELDIENTEFSPGVRRMQAAVGQEVPFDPASSSPACSGRFAEPTPSSPSAAATSTAGSRTTGRPAVRPDLHFYVFYVARPGCSTVSTFSVVIQPSSTVVCVL